MCGLAGGTTPSPELLKQFCVRLAHRGPDDEGIWSDDAIGLVHKRLSIIDLSPGGHQPMVVGNRYVIAYNGEIFNYLQLRRELEQRGESFRTNSDTEVLLALLARDGVEGLQRASGMFALALWDRREKELLLVRDRLGIKPLVYAHLPDGGIAFASEIQALLAHPQLRRDIDSDAVSEYLACLYIPAPRTIWRDIRKLPPGHLLRWKAGRSELSTWWTPVYLGTRRPSVETAVRDTMALLREVVAEHMVSDVPVGCFLSGGIDSSVIAALMAQETRRRQGPPVRTFTMTFDNPAYDERAAAREVAHHIGGEHTELPVDSESVLDRMTPMLRSFGEPFGNPTALLIDSLSSLARSHVTVALVGDGGDEVFAGYPRYRGGLLSRYYRRLPTWLRDGVIQPAAELIPEDVSGAHWARRVREFLLAAGSDPAVMYARWVEYFTPDERRELLELTRSPGSPIEDLYRNARSPHLLDAMQETDLLSFLPGNLLAYGDAMSMAHALELRLPLLDYRLVEFVGSLHPAVRFARGYKTILRGVASELLPRAIISRPKRGFNPPMGEWINGKLRPAVDEALSASRLAKIGINDVPVRKLLQEHRAGWRDHGLKIWALVVLERWRTMVEAEAVWSPT